MCRFVAVTVPIRDRFGFLWSFVVFQCFSRHSLGRRSACRTNYEQDRVTSMNVMSIAFAFHAEEFQPELSSWEVSQVNIH